MAKNRSGPSFGRLIFEELGTELAFGRSAEFLIRALPEDLFRFIADAVPEKVQNTDDMQDAIARIPRAFARYTGLPPFLTEGLQTLTKETLEEIGSRARQIPQDSHGRRSFVRGVVSTRPSYSLFENMEGFMGGSDKKASKKPMNFHNLLAEAPADTQQKFKDFLYDPLHFTMAQRREWLEKLAKITTTPERVIALCEAPTPEAFVLELEILVETEPDANPSLLAKASERFGVAGIGKEMRKEVDDLAKKADTFADEQREKARRRKLGGF